MEKKYVRVLWIKAHHRYAYSAGNHGIVDAAFASDLIKGGYIIPLPDTVEEKVNTLPQDFPGRTVLFSSGFDNLEKIRQAGDSLLDAGISKATLTKVKTYLSTH
jgi:hypothetical protein